MWRKRASTGSQSRGHRLLGLDSAVLLALFQLPLQFVPLAAPSTTIIASAVSLVATVDCNFGGILGMADETRDTTNFGTFERRMG